MRIRIVRLPPVASIDGIRTDRFEVGKDYQVGNSVAALFLAEGWAEPVALDAPAPELPFTDEDPFDSRKLYRDRPPNLVREMYRSRPTRRTEKPGSPGRLLAADFQKKKIHKPRPRKRR